MVAAATTSRGFNLPSATAFSGVNAFVVNTHGQQGDPSTGTVTDFNTDTGALVTVLR
jgi:adenine deaminase